MTRQQYWKSVAVYLSASGLKKVSGKDLDWETLEVLAETSGMLRKNIPDPIHMANNGLEHKFGIPNF